MLLACSFVWVVIGLVISSLLGVNQTGTASHASVQVTKTEAKGPNDHVFHHCKHHHYMHENIIHLVLQREEDTQSRI